MGLQMIQQSLVLGARIPDLYPELAGEAQGTHCVLCRDMTALRVAPPVWHRPRDWNRESHQEQDHACPD